ncbi:MAG TPA: ROK family protein [Chthoniobacteraceae bacterium]|jgi:glucokinase|nr:ROK family protein [Chthoniobacteraceae bacterium]
MKSIPGIGIDFGGTTIKSALVEEGAIIQRGEVIHTLHSGDSAAIIDALLDTVAALRRAHPDVEAIGVGLPGIVDSVNGIVHRLSNVPGWTDVPLREILHNRTGLHAEIENDANAMTYAEWKFGAAREGRNVVCMTLGTGVGGGLIFDGHLYRGSTLGAGEIGQMSIDLQGRSGNYGNLGALEKYVGNQQMAERAQQLYENSGKLVPLEQCTPAALAAAAHAGDPVAKQLWAQFGLELGVGLTNVVWLLNPDIIVIGGGVAQAGDLLFDPILRTIRNRTNSTFHECLRVVPAALGNDAGIIGSATIALDALDHPER